MNELRFDGRVAIITGAGAGLGRAYAELLASRGADVVVNDLDEQAVNSVVESIQSNGGSAVGVAIAVGSVEAADLIVSKAVDAFGRVDIVINNAGIVLDSSFPKMSVENFKKVYTVHLEGAFHILQKAFPIMKEQGYGRIVNTTSAAGLCGNFGQANYSAAKAGLVGLAKTLSIEGAKYNIRANSVSPGAATAMTEALVPDGVTMRPDQVAPVVAWLCHEDCELTGEIIHAAGGRVAYNFVAETRGMLFGDDMTIESVAGKMDEIVSSRDFVIPRDGYGSMGILLDMLKER